MMPNTKKLLRGSKVVQAGTGFRVTRRGFIRLSLLGALGFAGAKGFINSREVDLLNAEIILKRLPSAFDGLKVGQVTDIHDVTVLTVRRAV
jgi:hypothetical protein